MTGKQEETTIDELIRRCMKAQADKFAREEAARAPLMRCECCGVTGTELDLDDGACLLCREMEDAWG